MATSDVRRSASRASNEATIRDARDGEDDGDEPERGQGRRELGDGVDEQEVERRAAPLLEHDVEELADRLVADEERERLVLVRRPGVQLGEEKRGHAGRRRPDARARTSARDASAR